MSMVGTLRQISSSLLERIFQEPLLLKVIYEWDAFEESEKTPFAKESKEIFDVIRFNFVAELNYLFTGEVKIELPVVNEYLGGNQIGNPIGYQTPYYLTSIEVKIISNLLAKLPKTSIVERYDPEALRGTIYPLYWDNEDEVLDYILDTFNQIRLFYFDASAKQNAILFFLS
jgi:Domain of unknown function (DUF1877)